MMIFNDLIIQFDFIVKKWSYENILIFEDVIYHILLPFLTDVSISYPLKTPENQHFSGVSRGIK